MATVGGLVVYLTLNAVGLRHGLAQAQAELQTFRNAAQAGVLSGTADKDFAHIARGATVAGLAILGIGAASVRAATQFEYEMKLIRVQAGASTQEVKDMSAAILDMARNVQTGPSELARGLFHIESVGIRGAEALEVLETAAKGARVGNADLESVTNALIATVMSGIQGVDNMTQAMGTLNGIVGTGNLRMQELAKSFSSGTLSTARQFGLTIQDLGAALTTLTDQGVPAQEAMTRLRITITLLGAPVELATRELAKIGLTQRALADEMRGPRGLLGALILLKTHMQAAGLDVVEQSMLLKTAFGGSRSSAGILTLINSTDLYGQKLEQIMAKSGSFEEDFASQQKTASANWAELSAHLEVIGIKIGNSLIPVLILASDIIQVLTSNTDLLTLAFLALAYGITAVLVKAIANFIVGMGNSVQWILLHIKNNYAWILSIFGVGKATQTASAQQVSGAQIVAAANRASAASAQAAAQTYQVSAGQIVAAQRLIGSTSSSTATNVQAGNVIILGSSQTAASGTTAAWGQASRALIVYDATVAMAAQGVVEAVMMMSVQAQAAFMGFSQTVATAAMAVGVTLTELRIAMDALLAGPVARRQTRGPGGVGFGPLMTEAQMAAKVIGQAAGMTAAEIEAMMLRIAAALSQTASATGVWAVQMVTLFRGVAAAWNVTMAAFGTAPLVIYANAVRQAAAAQVPLLAGGAATARIVSGVGVAAGASTPFLSRLAAMFGATAATSGSASFSIQGLLIRLGALVGLTPAVVAGMGRMQIAALGVANAINAWLLPLMLVYTAFSLMGGNADKLAAGFLVIGLTVMFVLYKILELVASIPLIGEAFKGVRDMAKEALVDLMEISQPVSDRIAAENARQAAMQEAGETAEEYLNQLLNGVDPTALNQKMIEMWGYGKENVLAAAAATGAAQMREYSGQLLESFNAPREAIKRLFDMEEITPTEEIAGLFGFLDSPELQAKLDSLDDKAVAAGVAAQKTAVERIDQITQGAYSASLQGLEKFGDEYSAERSRRISAWLEHETPQNFKAMQEMTSLVVPPPDWRKWTEDTPPEVLQQQHENYRAAIVEFEAAARIWDTQAPTTDEVRVAWERLRETLDITGMEVEDFEQKVSRMINSLAGSTDVFETWRGLGEQMSGALLQGIGDGIKSNRQQLASVFMELYTTAEAAWSPGRQASFLVEQLRSSQLAASKQSEDPYVQVRAYEAQMRALEELNRLAGGTLTSYDQAAIVMASAMDDSVEAYRIIGEILGRNDLDAVMGARDMAAWLEQIRLKAENAGRSLSDMASDARSALTSSFDAIKQKADDYFRSVHENNLQAISDARDHKNALLDIKLAREQRPITQAQSALDHRMAEQQEYQLRQAVARATDPQSRLQAVWALRNFLDQRHIDEMREQADKAASAIERQKKRNDELYEDQVDAENKRYDLQKRSFDRQLQALERFLKAHPEMWATAQDRVLSLLRRYGVDFEDMGTRLGRRFRRGVSNQLEKIADNLKTLFESTRPNPQGGILDAFFGLFTGASYALGTHRVPKDEFAFLHAGEMVIPAAVAERIRFARRGHRDGNDMIGGGVALPRMEVRTDLRGGGDRHKKGGGTIIFQIGSEKLAELTDRALVVQEDIYAQKGGMAMLPGRSVR